MVLLRVLGQTIDWIAKGNSRVFAPSTHMTLLALVISAVDSTDKSPGETIEDLHALAANTLLVLAFVYATTALVLYVVCKDGVLRRMLPMR